MIALAAIFGVFALVAVSSLWKGYVLTILWSWFVVPTFELPSLAIAPAIGLSLLVSFLTHQSDASRDQKDAGAFSRAFAHSLLTPLVVLGVGWVVHQFM